MLLFSFISMFHQFFLALDYIGFYFIFKFTSQTKPLNGKSTHSLISFNDYLLFLLEKNVQRPRTRGQLEMIIFLCKKMKCQFSMQRKWKTRHFAFLFKSIILPFKQINKKYPP